ncbi:related to C2H2 transcription factor [Cephalotrichum gorgonifer]|uniref:Related to C2H2 transcription factor n=1 Tax=Cephalotrichum gorgonifer TaxID=2041049 RepID=A0AAE8N5F7_9PEZI|nr:related to C2H2 transcription factor [Cephalotrichum gorgonifer]
MVDEELHPCPLCSKRYKRREHMQRHWTSHYPARQHTCAQCSRCFQRLDVLKRHARTCEARARGWMPPVGRRRACDLCVRQKKACSMSQPCENCERASTACHYSFSAARDSMSHAPPLSTGRGSPESQAIEVSPENQAIEPIGAAGAEIVGAEVIPLNDFSSVMLVDPIGAGILGPDISPIWPDFLELMHGGAFAEEASLLNGLQHSQVESQDSAGRRYTFMFLENFTRRTGLLESFECGSPALREQTVAHFLHEQTEGDSPPMPGLPDALYTLPTDALRAGTPPFTTMANPWLHDPLMIKVHQIIVLAKEVVTLKPRNSVVTMDWSVSLEQRCLAFFSPENVRKFLELYWTIWHPNVNLVHRPTFDAASASPTLLAAMTVMGACMSPDLADRSDAKLWFNCVEEMVFTDDELCSEPLYTIDTGVWIPATRKRKVQALQAAYIVCLYQNWEGTDTSKRRIRRYRFGTVVSAARDIGLASATHSDLGTPEGHHFEWKAFAIKEELIRIFLWIFLLDHAFVTFNNLPPRMVIKEMKMHMARPEGCFQAATGEDCFEELWAWRSQSPIPSSLTLSEAVEMVCRGGMSEEMRCSLASLGPLNLFAIISAVHSLVFQHQNSIGACTNLTAIRHALDNWKPIWEHYRAELSTGPPHNMILGDALTPENAWRRIGFSRHAHEYWLLASVITDRIEGADASREGGGGRRELVAEAAAAEGGGPDPILTRYDQTSMRQVNDLIADFQKVQINSGGRDGI